jgi:release factor glutamine methyltransferase
MTIKELLKKSIKQLEEKKIKFPHLDAEILLADVLGKKREYLLINPDKKVSENKIIKYKKLIAKRLKNIPVAYLIGYKYFYGYKFIVNKDVLVPRPETEIIVDEVLKISKKTKKLKIIDIGTGSGCIILSIAKKINKNKDFKLIASDISKKALLIAKKNENFLKPNKKILFIKSNLLASFKKKLDNSNSDILITANLPYLTEKQINSSPSISSEPKIALLGGKDGLKYYIKLFEQIKKIKSKNKPNIFLILEIDPLQVKKISKIMNNKFKKASFEIKKDLSGLDRIMVIKF